MSCCVPFCSSTSGKNQRLEPGVTLHQIPKDPDRRKQWLAVIPRKNYCPGERGFICCLHFSIDDYETERQDNNPTRRAKLPGLRRKILKKTAVPSIFLGLAPLGRRYFKRHISATDNPGPSIKAENPDSTDTPVRKRNKKEFDINAIMPWKLDFEEPDQRESFFEWEQKYRTFSAFVDSTSHDSAQQVATLRSFLSDSTLDLVDSFNLPKYQADDPECVISALRIYAGKQSSAVNARFNFNLRHQTDNEVFDTFLADILSKANFCEFCDCCHDGLIRDKIIAGLNDARTVNILLKKPQLSLQETINICREEEKNRTYFNDIYYDLPMPGETEQQQSIESSLTKKSAKPRKKRTTDKKVPRQKKRKVEDITTTDPSINDQVPESEDEFERCVFGVNEPNIVITTKVEAGVQNGSNLPTQEEVDFLDAIIEMPDLPTQVMKTEVDEIGDELQGMDEGSMQDPLRPIEIVLKQEIDPNNPDVVVLYSNDNMTTTQTEVAPNSEAVMPKIPKKRGRKKKADIEEIDPNHPDVFALYSNDNMTTTQAEVAPNSEAVRPKIPKRRGRRKKADIEGFDKFLEELGLPKKIPNERFLCHLCPKEYVTARSLFKHLHDHEIQKPPSKKYKGGKCQFCDKVFILKKDNDKHLLDEHKDYRPYECKECPAKYSQYGHLHRHIQYLHKNERKFVCNICSLRFNEQNKLAKHNRFNHEIQTCDLCNEQFDTLKDLSKHQPIAHPDCKANLCDICGKGYSNVLLLKYHKRVHLRNSSRAGKHLSLSIPCKACDKKFSRNNYLMYHVKDMRDSGCEKHLKLDSEGIERPRGGIGEKSNPTPEEARNLAWVDTKPKCKLCNRVFTMYTTYRQHISSVHYKIKKHECDACDKKFSTPIGLRLHKKTFHLKLKTHECPHCHTMFNQGQHLKRHIAVLHDGVKFECEYCHKKYANRTDLKNHLRKIHDVEITFDCPHCYVKCSKRKDLVAHLDSVHKEDMDF